MSRIVKDIVILIGFIACALGLVVLGYVQGRADALEESRLDYSLGGLSGLLTCKEIIQDTYKVPGRGETL